VDPAARCRGAAEAAQGDGARDWREEAAARTGEWEGGGSLPSAGQLALGGREGR
jgi:hypothetical protein